MEVLRGSEDVIDPTPPLGSNLKNMIGYMGVSISGPPPLKQYFEGFEKIGKNRQEVTFNIHRLLARDD